MSDSYGGVCSRAAKLRPLPCSLFLAPPEHARPAEATSALGVRVERTLRYWWPLTPACKLKMLGRAELGHEGRLVPQTACPSQPAVSFWALTFLPGTCQHMTMNLSPSSPHTRLRLSQLICQSPDLPHLFWAQPVSCPPAPQL